MISLSLKNGSEKSRFFVVVVNFSGAPSGLKLISISMPPVPPGVIIVEILRI